MPVEIRSVDTHVITQINLYELSLYEKAGQISSYSVDVIAKGGQSYTDFDNSFIDREFPVAPGCVAIAIRKPVTQESLDFTPYWDVFKEIKSVRTS